jgi:hypothetical protein
VTGVQYNPQMEYVFLTSEQSGAVCLRDERMAFGPLSRRSREGVVQVVSVLIVFFLTANLRSWLFLVQYQVDAPKSELPEQS